MPTVDVRLVDVVKRYGEAVAVDHINLEVQTGEFFSLLGPSGCGKTTTLRMIGGFEEPTSGLDRAQGPGRRRGCRPTSATSTPSSRTTRSSRT